MLLARTRSTAIAVALAGLALGATTACGDDSTSSGAEDVAIESSAPDAGPRANEDHWHASFDVYVCDAFLGPFHDAGADTAGIHTHGDGLVHIHPFEDRVAGTNATFAVFADQLGLVVDDGTMTVPARQDPADLGVATDPVDEPAGTTWTDGDACPTGPGRVALFVWPADAADDAEPTEVIADIGATRFREDGERFVLAFVPEGVVPPQPPATPDLDSPSDLG